MAWPALPADRKSPAGDRVASRRSGAFSREKNIEEAKRGAQMASTLADQFKGIQRIGASWRCVVVVLELKHTQVLELLPPPLTTYPASARSGAFEISAARYFYIFTPRELTVPCPPMLSSTRHSGQYHFVVRAGMAERPTH